MLTLQLRPAAIVPLVLSGDFRSVVSKQKPLSSFWVWDFSNVCQESSLTEPSEMEYLYSE